MSLLERMREAVAPKELFNDKIKVHTTNSGTQYIEPSDLFNDEDWLNEVRQLSALMREVQQREAELAQEPPE